MAAIDLAKWSKSDPIKFKKSELKTLPPSTLDNLEDSNLFESFFWDILDIEVDRAVKYRVLLQIGQERIENVKNKIKNIFHSDIAAYHFFFTNIFCLLFNDLAIRYVRTV